MTDHNELLQKYYEELDTDKRRAYLEEYLDSLNGTSEVRDDTGESLNGTSESEGAKAGDPAAAYRKALFDFRYTDPKHPETQVDRFLRALLDLQFLYKQRSFFTGRLAREARKIVQSFEQDARVHTDEDFAGACRLEIRNAVRRYFDTCKADTYHRKLLGITASSAAEKEMQRCVDTWQMSQGLAERLHIQDDMELFCRAVGEEYQASREDGMTLEEAYREISS